jgi:lipopolysaccharide cholinephosphotransferase
MEAGTDLRRAQLVMLRLLKIFDALCAEYGLRYWLDAGTLLGAARHRGFIPWDDDIDVMMPVDDYRRFLAVAQNDLPGDVFLQTKSTDPTHDIGWAKLRDRYSYMDDPGGPYPYCQGIPIDIFPAYQQTENQFKARIFMSVLEPFKNSPMKTSPRFSWKHNAFNALTGIAQRMFRLVYSVPAVKRAFLKTTGRGILGWTYDPDLPWFHFFPHDCVFPLETIEFEDARFFAPADTDRYLTLYFGDWRTPPPEGRRGTHNVNGIRLTDAGPSPSSASRIWPGPSGAEDGK